MKKIYRGHEIEVYREQCLDGWEMLYYSIFRITDSMECASGHIDSDDEVEFMVDVFTDRVDEELESDDPWGEIQEQKEFKEFFHQWSDKQSNTVCK